MVSSPPTVLPNAESTPRALAGVRAVSPHLAGDLARHFSHEQYSIVERAFLTAQKLEGSVELDFEREPGVSFNPRAARIPLILMKEVEEKDCRILAASALSCVPDNLFRDAAEELGDASLVELAAASRQPAEKLAGDGQPAQRIHCALFLDRARQAHRASEADRARVRAEMLSLAAAELALAKRTHPRFETLLAAWHARFLR